MVPRTVVGPFALRARATAGALLLLGALAACKSGGEPTPPPPGVACAENSGRTLALGTMQGEIDCVPPATPGLDAPGGTGSYLVVPQFPVEVNRPQKVGITVNARSTGGAADAPLASLAGPASPAPAGSEVAQSPAQARLDAALRAWEHGLVDEVQTSTAGIPWRSATGGRRARVMAASLDSIRQFYVLKSLSWTTSPSFVTVTAARMYLGNNVAIYVDTMAPAGFTSTDLQSFGALFDDRLYTIDTTAFGGPSDVDQNGHIIVLLTPQINKLTAASSCRSAGYVAGYFFAYDLSLQATSSNKGEVFYSIVPDPDSTYSCPHKVADVKAQVPVTFVHEFQHMISYGQKVIRLHSPTDESTWLNEGLSHIAEELGGRWYLNAGFADTAWDYLQGDYYNAYSYLKRPDTSSVTSYSGTQLGTLPERGGSWLFLRWLGDQEGEQIYKNLVQSTQAGIQNVQAQAGVPFDTLFGRFGIALWTDSLPGVTANGGRGPDPYRFHNINLRRAMLTLSPVFPLAPVTLNCGASLSGSMVPGTSLFYIVNTSSCTAASLRFAKSTGAALPDSLDPQAGIFRLP